MEGQLLTRHEAKRIGHSAGMITGTLGVLLGFIFGDVLYWTEYQLASQGKIPGVVQVADVVFVILATYVVSVWAIWKMDFPGKRFRMRDAGPGVAGGLVQGFATLLATLSMALAAIFTIGMLFVGTAIVVLVVVIA